VTIPPTGWIHDPGEVRSYLSTLPRPSFNDAAPHLWGSGAGETVLLYKAWKDVTGGYPPYPAQTIGDCVSQAFSHAIDLLACVEIAIGKEAETFKETSSEAIYGMARVDIGGQRGSRSDGAVGAWGAKAVGTLGTVSREVTGPYDGRRAKEWGAAGVPAEIKAKAKGQTTRINTQVTTWGELEDALANGYPVVVCSDQGFTMERGQDGFCRPQGSWMHAMFISGVRTDKPGACIVQSWGANVPSGPTSLDQPDFSFWAERKVVERMLGQGDSWVVGGFNGYPGRPLPRNWTYDGLA
jgi:hypothetical protein